MNYAEIYTLLCKGYIESISQIIEEAPPANNKEFSIQLLQIDDPLAITNAISPLCIEYTFGKNCEFGVELAKAAFLHARDLYNLQQGDFPLMLMTVSRFILNVVNGLTTLGRFQEVIDYLEEHLKYLEDRNAKENMSSIILVKVNAWLNLNQIDEADDLVNSMKEEEIEWDARIEYDRLLELINKLKGSAHEDSKKKKNPKKNISPITDLINKFDPTIPDDFLKKGTDFLTGDSSEMNQWKADQITRESTGIFLGTPSQEEIKNSLEKLNELRQWTKDNGTTSSDNDVLWGLYLCNNRLGHYSKAADVLLDMQLNHEGLRANIKNPVERAGVYSNYPYFFGALCKMLVESNREEELLNAIESSKGRAIADVLTDKSGIIVSDRQISEPANKIPDLCKKNNFHYLTYFVDDEEVFAVLVSKDGKIYSAGSINISKSDLRKATYNASPENWGKVIFSNMKKQIIPETSKTLAPLLSWLMPLVDKGVLAKNDHICYSPDENIFNVPLHYVLLNGKELFEYFSISRVHGAFALMLSLEKTALIPEYFISFIVPTIQDKENKSSVGVYNNLLKTQNCLVEILEGKSYLEEKANKTTVQSCEMQNKIIHFGTHGVFPQEGAARDQNPFKGSGLLFSSETALPDRDRIAQGLDTDLILTPEDIFNSNFNLMDSHVSMQACVSGLAKEGIGGDSIGLEWTLLLAGAASVLSTHWNIGAAHSYEFITRFYKYWLRERNSKAVAWRKAVLELKKSNNNELNDPYVYAAYSLTGNWN